MLDWGRESLELGGRGGIPAKTDKRDKADKISKPPKHPKKIAKKNIQPLGFAGRHRSNY